MKTVPLRLALCLVWLAAVAAGLGALLNYEVAPGRSGSTPPQWPADAPVSLDSARPTLLMFAHPKCPCTEASIGELNRLLARCEGRVAAHIFFLQPAGLPPEWVQSKTWRAAAALPGVSLHRDLDGTLARRFGAETSGFVVLFDPAGRLLFQGGITSGRGHAGDNAGASAIVSLLAGQPADLRQTQVFGCSITGPGAASRPAGGAWTP